MAGQFHRDGFGDHGTLLIYFIDLVDINIDKKIGKRAESLAEKKASSQFG